MLWVRIYSSDLEICSLKAILFVWIILDSHKSFKLRLPSLRKDLCRRMLSRGAGSVIPDIESLPVSPVSESQLVAADISFLSTSNFGRLLAAEEHDNIANDVVLISPTNHCQLVTDHNSIFLENNDHERYQFSSATPSVPKLNHDSSVGSSNHRTSLESDHFSELPLSDSHYIKSLPHEMTPLENELISPLKRFDRDSHNIIPSASKQSFLLPTANVKHNVTEKVAQVCYFYLLLIQSFYFNSL